MLEMHPVQVGQVGSWAGLPLMPVVALQVGPTYSRVVGVPGRIEPARIDGPAGRMQVGSRRHDSSHQGQRQDELKIRFNKII